MEIKIDFSPERRTQQVMYAKSFIANGTGREEKKCHRCRFYVLNLVSFIDDEKKTRYVSIVLTFSCVECNTIRIQ